MDNINVPIRKNQTSTWIYVVTGLIILAAIAIPVIIALTGKKSNDSHHTHTSKPASTPASTPASKPSHSKPSHSKPSHSTPSHSTPSHSKPSHSTPSHSTPASTPKPIYSPCDNLFNRWGDPDCKLWIDQDPGRVNWSNYMENCAKACCEQGAVKGMNDCEKLSDKKGKGDTLINGISAQCAKGVKGYYDSTTGTWMGPNQFCAWPEGCMKTCCQQRFLGDGNCATYISAWNKLGSKVPGWPKKCLKDGRLCSKADPKCVEKPSDDAGVY